MVRQRLGIAEDAPADEADARSPTACEHWIADPGERERVGEALGALLGTAEPGLAREELFAAWRLFFERLAERDPVVLVFEDMHWADDGLLDFLEQLLDWSAEHPIFVCCFARPELAERRAGLAGRGRQRDRGWRSRRSTPSGSASCSTGRSPGCPAALRGRIVEHSEGIPLYAVETVRALADRGVLASGDAGLAPVRARSASSTCRRACSSLLSARLDALGGDERELIRAMAVFGGTLPARRRAAR